MPGSAIRLRSLRPSLLPHQLKLIEDHPEYKPIFFPCSLRGDKPVDITQCGMVIYPCSVHGTCSTHNNSGVHLCQKCNDYHGG